MHLAGAVGLGPRLRDLDLGSETGTRNTSKAETTLNVFSQALKNAFWGPGNQAKASSVPSSGLSCRFDETKAKCV